MRSVLSDVERLQQPAPNAIIIRQRLICSIMKMRTNIKNTAIAPHIQDSPRVVYRVLTRPLHGQIYPSGRPHIGVNEQAAGGEAEQG